MSQTTDNPAVIPEKAPRLQVVIAFTLLLFFSLLLRVGKFPALYKVVRACPTSQWFLLCGSKLHPRVIATAVDSASTWLPIRILCLEYSAALVVLLRAHAVPANLVIGVMQRPFSGHAWVVIDGEVVGPRTYTDTCSVLDRS